MEAWIARLEPEYRSYGSRNTLCFSFAEEDLIAYQLEMIRQNQIPCLLSCEVLKVDSLVRLQYDVTSLLPLHKVLERRVINRHDFMELAGQISGLFQILDDYLMDYDGILLDSRFIYCSPDENKLYFIHVPDKCMPKDHHEALKKLLLNLVIQEIKFADEASDNYVQRLIERLKAPDFSLDSLKTYLDGNKQSYNAKPQTTQEASFKTVAALQAPLPGGMPLKAPEIRAEVPRNPQSPVAQMRPPVLNEPKKAVKPITQTTEKQIKVYPLKSYIILGSAIVGLLALLLVLFLNGSLSPDDPDMVTTLVGMLLIGGALIYLVCSKVFTPDKKVGKTVPQKVVTPVLPVSNQNAIPVPNRTENPKGSYVNTSIRPVSPNPIPLSLAQSAFSQAAASQSVISQTAISQVRPKDKTVLLSEKSVEVPALKRLGTNPETIPIHKWPFMIGRLGDQVDYCVSNPAIGKLHAELIKKENAYYITDMNSRNGSFVNGTRVEAGQEMPIKDGDRILLANEEFMFCNHQ